MSSMQPKIASEPSVEMGILTADQRLLQAQGHVEEMPRQFSVFSILGLAFSITNSWIAIFAIFQQPVNAGGGPGVFYALLVASVTCFVITLGLAELASAFPTCGGQYHFAFMLSSKGTRAFTAFVTGWLSVVAWILCTAASAIYAAQMFAYLAAAYHENYTPTTWQIWLIYVAIMVACAAVLCILPTKIPQIEKVLFFASVLGFLVFTVTALATSSTKNSAYKVFVDYDNSSGWSDGLAFMISCGTAMYTYIGTDSAIHISEEIPNPARVVPRTMCLTMIIGILTAIPWTIAFLFSGGDLESLGNSTLPIRILFLRSTNRPAAATFFTCWLLIIYLGATMGCLAATGRQTWAFARDNGLPFSKWHSVIHTRLEMPINATVSCTIIISLYGIIYVGSTAAFNSFISVSILVMNVSYAIPQGILLFRGRKKLLRNRPFSLNVFFGPLVNAFSVLWVALYVVLFCFPIRYPTTVGSMNYVSIVAVGVVLIIIGLWIGGKKNTFSGPKIPVELFQEEFGGTIVGQPVQPESDEGICSSSKANDSKRQP